MYGNRCETPERRAGEEWWGMGKKKGNKRSKDVQWASSVTLVVFVVIVIVIAVVGAEERSRGEEGSVHRHHNSVGRLLLLLPPLPKKTEQGISAGQGSGRLQMLCDLVDAEGFFCFDGDVAETKMSERSRTKSPN